MTPRHRTLAVLVAAGAALLPTTARSQCIGLSENSPEAKLLAFYAVPLAFNASSQPEQLLPWHFRFTLEVTPMPAADSARRATTCYASSKQESTNLASVFPRPRVAVGLPFNFEAELSWVPPLKVKDAQANLIGLSLAWTRRVAIVAGASVIAQARVHTVIGSVEGPITCGIDALQANALLPCYGRTPSNDRYTPNLSGGELNAAIDLGDYAIYVSGGVNSLAPEFQVNFPVGAGYPNPPAADRSLVTLGKRLSRYTVGAGATWRIFRGVDLSAQLYNSVNDVSITRIMLSYVAR